MDTAVQDNPELSRYEITLDGEFVGKGDYEIADGRISFTHTNINPDQGGKGLAKILVAYELDDARARGLQVIPVCPYVLKVIAEDEDNQWIDLVPADERARLGLPR